MNSERSEVAKGLGIRHCPEITRTEYGTPLLNGMFARALLEASNEFVCYINSEIIFDERLHKGRCLCQFKKAFCDGRPFLFHTRNLGLPLIEATKVILGVHQNHDYRHVPERKGPRWEGPEADRYFELAGGWQYIYTQEEATHRLTESGLKLRLDWRRLKRHIHTIPELHPRLFPLYWMANAAARVLGGLHLR